jgi:flavin-dependent dehydrogenase
MDKTVQNGKSYDVVVIGGGPAGSTAAAVLAEKGRRVAVIEREKFPRYHIGESMIPYCYFTLERLGLVEKMQASHFPKKFSVQFVGGRGKMSTPFYFTQHMDHPAAQSWQVVRSEFDQMMLDNAREKGADVFEETTVKDLIQEDGAVRGVRATTKDGSPQEFRAPITIDASGRDALSISRNRWRVRDAGLNKVALWTYYTGAVRDPGIDEGATTVAYLPEKGWFWYIPLPNDTVSVGIVAEKDYLYTDTRELGEIFEREVKKNIWIEAHLATGTRSDEYRVTGEFSYRSEYSAADGLVLTGDAFSFLDPVFSSGLFLALRGGELAGDAADAALASGDFSAGQFGAYSAELCAGIEAMRKLVYAFYDHDFNFGKLIAAHPDLRPALTDCLIGHVRRDFDALFAGVSEFARVPPALEHGRPLVEAR